MNPFKIVAAIFGTFALLAAIIAGFIALRQNAQLDSGGQFSRSVAEMIVTNWSADYFISNSSQQLLTNLDTRGIRMKLDTARRIGQLQSLGETRGELVNPSWLPTGEPLVARYYTDAEFSGGPAEIYTELVVENGAWKLLNFYIQSPVLAE